MFKFAQFTIYEVVGYLLPGGVFVAAVGILAWSEWAPNIPLPVFSPSFALWALLAIVAYYAGHAVQGVANFLLDNDSFVQRRIITAALVKLRELLKISVPCPEFPTAIQNLATTKAKKVLGNTDAILEFEWIQKLAGEALVQRGVVGEQEIDIYRQGFYRGSIISLLVFAIAVWVRASCGVTCLYFWSKPHRVYEAELIWLGALCTVAAFVFWPRLNRFGKHQRKGDLLGFLVLDTERKDKPKNGKDD